MIQVQKVKWRVKQISKLVMVSVVGLIPIVGNLFVTETV